MSGLDVIRAWKDENYRLGLSSSELESVPENPAGMIDLTDSNLDGVAGATIEDGGVFTFDVDLCGMIYPTQERLSFDCTHRLCCRVPPGRPPV